MKRQSLNSIISNIGNFAEQIQQAAAAKAWLETHREELVLAIKTGAAVEAVAIVNDFCSQFPPFAALIIGALGGSTDEAIQKISMFDPQLESELQSCRESFAKCQAAIKQLSNQQSANSSQ